MTLRKQLKQTISNREVADKIYKIMDLNTFVK